MKVTYLIAPDRRVYASCSWDPKARSAADDLIANPCSWVLVASVAKNGELVNWRGMADLTPCWAGGDAEADALQNMEPLRAGETYIMELDGPVAGIILRNAQFGAASFPGELPEPYCYVNEVHKGWPEYNKIDEFSGGRTGGVKLYTEEQVRKLLATPASARPFTLTKIDGIPPHTNYEGVIATLPGQLLITMGLTLDDEDNSAYLTFDAGQVEGGAFDFPISRAAADAILAACLEPK